MREVYRTPDGGATVEWRSRELGNWELEAA
jgi:hypothetical protein